MTSSLFSDLIGNEGVKRQLRGMLSKGALGQALLFAGPEGVGKSLFALDLAAALMPSSEGEGDPRTRIRSGRHPDVHHYRPEGKLGLHSIQSLRELGEAVHLPPYESGFNVFIIHEAERMVGCSANALLKTFEEPPRRTLFILLSDASASLLPTIRSRCYTLYFRPIPAPLIREFIARQAPLLAEAELERVVRQAAGSLGRALRLAVRGNDMRMRLFQGLMQGSLQNYRLLQESVKVLGEEIEQMKKEAEESAREGWLERYGERQLSAQQQGDLEKELEGAAALALKRGAEQLFEGVLSWYRDLQWVLMGGGAEGLMHPDFYPQLERAVQRGECQPLERVAQIVQEALVTLQQSTPLSLCLENLFLKLDATVHKVEGKGVGCAGRNESIAP